MEKDIFNIDKNKIPAYKSEGFRINVKMVLTE